MFGARECANNHKANRRDTIWTSVARELWRLSLCPIAMIITLAWFGCNDVRERAVLTATRSHKHSRLLAWECVNYQCSFAMKIAMNNRSTATIPRKLAVKDSMFDHNQDCDEQMHVWLRQRSRQTISWLSTTMNATINLTIGDSVQPHNFRWKLGPTLQRIACCKQLQQTIATIHLKKGRYTHNHHAGDCGCILGLGCDLSLFLVEFIRVELGR